MSDRLKQIRRIQKLQALARGEAEGGNTIAAENAARIAAKLMVAHAISAIEVSTPTSAEMRLSSIWSRSSSSIFPRREKRDRVCEIRVVLVLVRRSLTLAKKPFRSDMINRYFLFLALGTT